MRASRCSTEKNEKKGLSQNALPFVILRNEVRKDLSLKVLTNVQIEILRFAHDDAPF